MGIPSACMDRCISLCRSFHDLSPWATRPLWPNSFTAYSADPLTSFALKTRAVPPWPMGVEFVMTSWRFLLSKKVGEK